MRAKVYHMGVKALHRKAFAVRLKTKLIWLISCRASSSATVEADGRKLNKCGIRQVGC